MSVRTRQARREKDRRAARLMLVVACAAAVAAGAIGASAAARALTSAPGAWAAAATTPPAGASAAPAATPGPSPSPFASRPPTKDGPVPANLHPTLATAPTDYPRPYLDGCHVPLDGRRPTWACVYGRSTAKTTIVLFGDSHALAWFPAVLRIAADRGWRLVNLTMSACSPADIPQWIAAQSSVSAACSDWRRWAIGRIEAEKPAVVIVAGTRGFATVDASGRVATGSARTKIWEAGIDRTLKRLVAASGRVIYLSDTPASALDPPECLAENPRSVLACTTPVSRAVNIPWFIEEQRVAAQEGVGFIDTTAWICPTGPCPVTLGNLLVYRDGGHMTATFVTSLGPRLEAAVAADLARHPSKRTTP